MRLIKNRRNTNATHTAESDLRGLYDPQLFHESKPAVVVTFSCPAAPTPPAGFQALSIGQNHSVWVAQQFGISDYRLDLMKLVHHLSYQPTQPTSSITTQVQILQSLTPLLTVRAISKKPKCSLLEILETAREMNLLATPKKHKKDKTTQAPQFTIHFDDHSLHLLILSGLSAEALPPTHVFTHETLKKWFENESHTLRKAA